MNKVIVNFLVALLFSLNVCADQSMEDAFTKVYRDKWWGVNKKKEGSSGSGSTLNATEGYRALLQDFFSTHNITSVVDFGCGDWEFSQAIDWDGIDYVGIDVVKSVVEKNIINFASPNITFIHSDGLEMDLPEADLLICKDVLQHLPNKDIMIFLKQIHKFKYCLITNDVDLRKKRSKDNIDIPRGYCRFVNLTKPPFNIVGTVIYSFPTEKNKQVLLIIN